MDKATLFKYGAGAVLLGGIAFFEYMGKAPAGTFVNLAEGALIALGVHGAVTAGGSK